MWYRKSIIVVLIALVAIAAASIRLDPALPVVRADAAGPTFSHAVLVEAGLHANSIAAADFNEDGIMDLAVTNRSSTNVSILLGTGNGGFGAAINYPLATNISAPPFSIAVGDFNSDGHLDFVAAASIPIQGNVFLRLGNGTFGDSTRFVTGNVAIFVVAADFNWDGKLDLAVANEGGDFLQGEGPVVHFPASVSVLAGDGQGGFAAPQAVVSYSSPKVPAALSVGDFNNDGLPDLAVANNNSKVLGNDPALDSVTILLNQRAGGLGIAHEVPLANGPTYLINHDLDNDGELDLAVTGKAPNTISVLLGDGNGNFASPTTFPAGGFRCSLGAGDFDGDGNVDLATSCQGNARTWIIRGEAQGNFGSPVQLLDQGYGFLVVTDLNHDGKGDLALADTWGESPNSISILYNTSEFQPGLPWLLTYDNTSRAIALDSVTFQRDPFRVCATHNFSVDELTRVILFSHDDIDAMAGRDISAVTAQAEDDQGGTYPLVVEYVGQVPANSQLTQVVVKLADSIKLLDKVWLTVSASGVRSNRVLVRITPDDCNSN